MPELPEVQTVVNFLKPALVGKKILSVKFLSSRIIYSQSTPKFKQKLIGQKIINVERVGKWIVLKLSSGECFLFHLMMTGKLLLNPKEDNKHDRLILNLSGNACGEHGRTTKLVFNDIRQFGRCVFMSFTPSVIPNSPSVILNGSEGSRDSSPPAQNDRTEGVQNDKIHKQSDFWSRIGADPLKIKFKKFQSLVTTKNKIIKNFLLDQKLVAGIGNIYADEILWKAGIHPMRKTNTLKDFEISKIFESIKKILKLAIQKEGTSSRNYRKPDGTEGEYYKIRKAYQRTGEKCLRCDGTIKRILVGGRSTHFCPKHQI